MLMAHQMQNLGVFSVFHYVEGAFGAASGGTPKIKNGVLREKVKNGRGRVSVVPYLISQEVSSSLEVPKRKIQPALRNIPPSELLHSGLLLECILDFKQLSLGASNWQVILVRNSCVFPG